MIVISTSLEGMSGYLDLTTPSFSILNVLNQHNHLMMCSNNFIMRLITLYNASLWPTDRTRGEVSVIFNFFPLQKSDMKKEKGKGSEDLRLV